MQTLLKLKINKNKVLYSKTIDKVIKPKFDFEFETLGTFEEVIATLNFILLIAKNKNSKINQEYYQILHWIFGKIKNIANIMTTDKNFKSKITKKDITKIIYLTKKLNPKISNFIFKFKTYEACLINFLRIITRKLERYAIKIKFEKNLKNINHILFLNNLSRLLFYMSINIDKLGKKKKLKNLTYG